MQFEPCKAERFLNRAGKKKNRTTDGRRVERTVTEGRTRSLVKLGVDGNLKVIVVEVGRLVQYRQHILDHSRETTRVILRKRNKNRVWGDSKAGVTHREHVLLVPLRMWLLLCVVLCLLLALPLGPHCLRCSWGVLGPRLRAVWEGGVGVGGHRSECTSLL